MAGVHCERQALSLQAARDRPPQRLRSRRASSASSRLEPEAVTQDAFLPSQSLGLCISCTLGRTSQVEGRFGGYKAGSRFPPRGTHTACFEGFAVPRILLDSILSGSKLKIFCSNLKWEKSLKVVHLFKWIFIIKF